MDKLEKAYEGLELLKSIGMNGSEEQLRIIKQMEKQYIDTEVIPLLKQEIEPLINKLLNKFSFQMDFNPNGEIDIQFVEESVHEKNAEDNISAKLPVTRSSSLGFKVIFDDGTIIKYADAKTTFVEALKRIGLEKVAGFDERTFKGYSLVGREKRTDCDFICQVYEEGWYVYIAMANDTKMEVLTKVARKFGVPLKIIKDDGTDYSESSSSTSEKSGRESFSLCGSEPLTKRRTVLETVRKYVNERPMATFSEISEAFPDRLQGSYGVVKSLDWVDEKDKIGFDFKGRYFMAAGEIFTAYDGVEFVVSNQWGTQFYRFIDWVKDTLGWEIESV